MDRCSAGAEGAGHKPPGAGPNHSGGEKHTENKAHKSIFFIISSTVCMSPRWRLLHHKGDISFLPPQKTPLRCQGPSASGPKPKKMPFVAGKVKEASQVVALKPAGAD